MKETLNSRCICSLAISIRDLHKRHNFLLSFKQFWSWNYQIIIWKNLFCSNGLGCEHGTCVQHPSGGENFCVCETGWQGDSCDRCVPYWECPQPNTRSGIPACVNPNDCICTTPGLADPKGLCGHEELGGTRTLGR